MRWLELASWRNVDEHGEKLYFLRKIWAYLRPNFPRDAS